MNVMILAVLYSD
uniref:Uncharacterized protein n=1 Tax=Arundo donax TaxID=35708 RepID=A0A0A8XXG3_ARUDO